MSRVALDESLDVKTEEVLLKDLVWENETYAKFPKISSSPGYGEVSGIRVSQNDSKQNKRIIENMNSPVK